MMCPDVVVIAFSTTEVVNFVFVLFNFFLFLYENVEIYLLFGACFVL